MTKNIKFTVSGMHCGSCAQHITMELSDVPGITDVVVDQKTGLGRAILTLETLTETDVIAAVERAGYKAEIVR